MGELENASVQELEEAIHRADEEIQNLREQKRALAAALEPKLVAEQEELRRRAFNPQVVEPEGLDATAEVGGNG